MFLSPFAGVTADRSNPVRMMWLTQAIIVQGHIHQVSRVRVPTFAGDRVLGRHLYLGFHRRTPDITDFSLKGDQIANADRVLEGQLVDGDRHYTVMRMPHTSQSANFIGQFHDPATMHVAEHIGVFGMHQLGEGDTRVTGRLTFNGF